MNLRKKVILTVGAVFAGLAFTLTVVSYSINANSSRELEARYGKNAEQLVRLTLDNQLAALDSITYDWASWDDTYEFMQDANEAYVESNLLDETFPTLSLNLAAYFDTGGNTVFLKFFDLDNELAVEPPPDLQPHLAPGTPLAGSSGAGETTSGIILAGGKPMLVASRPILTSRDEGPARGVLVFGRYLDASSFGDLIAIRHPVIDYVLDDPGMPAGGRAAQKTLLSTGQSYVIEALDKDRLGVYTLISDIYGEPLLIIQVNLNRDIYQQGLADLLYSLISLLVVGAVLGAVLLWVLDRQVLRRLTQLDSDIRHIEAEGNLSDRVSLPGSDEISTLALSINNMLDALEKSKERLEESEMLLRQVFDGSPSLIFLKDSQGKYLLVNKAWTEFHRVSAQEVSGKTDRDLAEMGRFSREDAENFIANDRALLESGQTRYSADERITGPDGTPRWFQKVKVSLPAGGNACSILGIATDVTEVKQLEARLLQSQKLESLGRLAGGIAHDFNNLLTVIIGNAELSLDKLPLNSPSGKRIEQIMLTAERASRLIRQLLLFSRQSRIVSDRVNLNGLVEDITDMLNRLIGEDISLVTRFGIDAGEIDIDKGQIEQALMNMAVNARDAMPDGGILTIETARVSLAEEEPQRYEGVLPGNYVMLSVSDTGEGMDENVLSHLFEPFFSTKAEGKGTGLGLATAYGIIKRHHGHIYVESELLKGSTFRIFLPETPAAESKKCREDSRKDLPEGNETILVVEDDSLVRETMTEILEMLGYNILEAANGNDALQTIKSYDGKIDLVLSDIVMPYMTGRGLAARLRSSHPELRVLLTSGYIHHALLDGLDLDNEATPFLRKPLTAVSLAQKVRQALDHPRNTSTR